MIHYTIIKKGAVILSQYIITDGTRFIYKNHANKYVPSPSEAMADIFTRKQAEGIYNNSLPKALKSVFHLQKYDTPPEGIKQVEASKTYNSETVAHSEGIERWKDKINTLNGLVEEALQRKDELGKQLSEVDQELSDIAHYIEFCNLNAAQGYKAYKMIKDRRIRRRSIKNELELVKAILDGKICGSLKGEMDNIVNNIENKKYEPKILQELFD